jgi:hypothetical protein
MSTLWDTAVAECGTEIVPGYAQPVIVLATPQAVADLFIALTQYRHFCARCGKRQGGGTIHTCTPPAD